MKSRRKAREAILRTLYCVEIGKGRPDHVLEEVVREMDLNEGLAEYAKAAVPIWRTRLELDAKLKPLVKDYDYLRLAAIDRNIMRLAAFELLNEPSIPPAVTLDEAIELAKKYSTAESGKFVNGVLGRFLRDTPKATWDPTSAPAEAFESRAAPEHVEPEPEVVKAESQEGKEAIKFGWVLKSGDPV